MLIANIIGMNNNSCIWCHDYDSTQISKFSSNVWIVNKYLILFWDPQNIIDMFQDHETYPHGWILLCTKMPLCIRQYTTWAYNDKLQSLAYYFDPHYEEQTLLLCVFQRPKAVEMKTHFTFDYLPPLPLWANAWNAWNLNHRLLSTLVIPRIPSYTSYYATCHPQIG